MDAAGRVVMCLPLEALWRGDAHLEASRVRDLHRDEVRELLAGGPVAFVIADVGRPLSWIPVADCYALWKEAVQHHVAEGQRIELQRFPKGLAYVASEWRISGEQRPTVLLEAHH